MLAPRTLHTPVEADPAVHREAAESDNEEVAVETATTPQQQPGQPTEVPGDETGGADSTASVARARQRLMRDFRRISEVADGTESGFTARLHNNDLFEWRALICGPEGTPWEGGLFKLLLQFTPSYPVCPPNVKFITPIFHPNVYVSGNICLDTLQSNWNPSLDVQSLLISIQSLLCDPNPHSSANTDAGSLLLRDPHAYYQRVECCCEASLQQEFTSDDDDDDEA